ncbi:Acetyltransferase (GNAT) family protein [Cohnella sp. OV330]|uniref:GNAT family N-acetyltransferase n=1 Tax=Cohnella sp. OV330 TaxID=1855288 RepID=UPI0008E9A6C0|nr:GNAT family N-acetyltransferase [Cohnella sp. OV330]SFB56442.1 Acetyltransferase (GNAT) family protein [Cohnella sp. OV330]
MEALEIEAIQDAVPGVYTGLIPPVLSHVLQQRLPASFLALGARRGAEPVGVAIAERREASDTAGLLALTVSEPERRQGVGRALFGEIETALRQTGTRAIGAEYLGGADPDTVEAAFLKACGFGKPRHGIQIWGGSTGLHPEMPWVYRLRLPDVFAVRPFTTLTTQEYEEVRQGEGVWYTPDYSPFADENLIDKERSLLLRYGGAVVGWMIFEPFDTRTMLFKTMFVHPRHQRMGRGIALAAEGGRRLIRDPAFSEWLLFVEARNADMVRFLARHVSCPGVQKEVLWRTVKLL